MKKNIYIQPDVRFAQLKRQPILAGSEQVPTSESAADEWSAKETTGFWDGDPDEDE